MLDILKNFNEAEKGNKKSAGTVDVNNMKTILESFQSIEECGMEMEAPTQGVAATQEQPVTINVTASGKENVADLIALMQQAAGIEQHVDMPMAHDAHIDTDSHNVSGQDMDMAAMKKALMGPEESVEEEDYANEPDEEYKDHNFMTKDLSGGINRQKKSHKPTNGADNPMALETSIKDQLWAALNEKKLDNSKKMHEGRGRGKKKTKEEMTAEGRGKGRGRGKKK